MNFHFTWALCALASTSCSAAAPLRSPPAAPAAPAQVTARPAEPSRREVVRHVLPRSVRVLVLEGKTVKRTASGVVVGSEATASGTSSYILTNEHVVNASDLKEARLQVVVETVAGLQELEGAPVAMGKVPEMDLALVKVRGVLLDSAELAGDDELEAGDDVVVVAAPYGRALSVSGGMVSLVERDPKSRVPTMLKTDAPIGYGASGGGVFSRTTGKLLAIVEGYRTAKVGFAVAQQDYSFDVPMPGETFAAPAAKVRAFLEKNGYGRLLGKVASVAPLRQGSALQ